MPNRKGFSFTNRTTFGRAVRDTRELPSFPPFPASELNTTDSTGLGTIVVDSFGRAFQKVRYAGTNSTGASLGTVAPSYGKIAAWSVPLDSATHGVTPCTTSDIITTLATDDGANALKGWLLGISSSNLAGATTLTQGGWKQIYSSSGASAAYHAIVSEARKDILNGNSSAVYDANRTLTFAGADGLYPTGRDLCFSPPAFDVTLAVAGAGPVYTTQDTRGCGVFLGTVTAPSITDEVVADSNHAPEQDAGVPLTFYYTWIQIYGPGMVRMKASEACVANDTLICADVAATAGDGLVYPSSGPPSLLQYLASVGTSMVTDNTAVVRLVPTFICPGYRSMYGL